MNGHCVMRLPITETDRSADPMNNNALSREPGNPGWTVAPLDADDMVNHNNNNRVHTMNNRDWTDEQKKIIVEIDENERKEEEIS